LIGQEIPLLTTKRASRRTLLLKKFIPIDRAGDRVLELYNWGSQRNSKDETAHRNGHIAFSARFGLGPSRSEQEPPRGPVFPRPRQCKIHRQSISREAALCPRGTDQPKTSRVRCASILCSRRTIQQTRLAPTLRLSLVLDRHGTPIHLVRY